MIVTDQRVDVKLIIKRLLLDWYGTSDVQNLTSAERLSAYEVSKKRLRKTARNEEEYQQFIKQTVAFLEI